MHTEVSCVPRTPADLKKRKLNLPAESKINVNIYYGIFLIDYVYKQNIYMEARNNSHTLPDVKKNC